MRIFEGDGTATTAAGVGLAGDGVATIFAGAAFAGEGAVATIGGVGFVEAAGVALAERASGGELTATAGVGVAFGRGVERASAVRIFVGVAEATTTAGVGFAGAGGVVFAGRPSAVGSAATAGDGFALALGVAAASARRLFVGDGAATTAAGVGFVEAGGVALARRLSEDVGFTDGSSGGAGFAGRASAGGNSAGRDSAGVSTVRGAIGFARNLTLVGPTGFGAAGAGTGAGRCEFSHSSRLLGSLPTAPSGDCPGNHEPVIASATPKTTQERSLPEWGIMKRKIGATYRRRFRAVKVIHIDFGALGGI